MSANGPPGGLRSYTNAWSMNRSTAMDTTGSALDDPKVGIVVPVFNSSETIEELVTRLQRVCSDNELRWELVFIDDGSADASWSIIERLAGTDSRIRALRFSRNFGQHHALTAGLDLCDADWVVLMDADLQDRPEEIVRLLEMAYRGYDVVLARRRDREDWWGKQWAARMFYRLFGWLTGTRWDPAVGVFRVISRPVVLQLRSMREQLRFIAGLVDWLGFPTATVDVKHAARPSGRSQYTLTRLLRLAGAAALAHADRPLWIAVIAGICCALISFGAVLWLLARLIWSPTEVMGPSVLLAVMTLLGGITISLLGVLGLYLGRLFPEVKRRPLYVVRSSLNVVRDDAVHP